MNRDILARGSTLTPALCEALEREVAGLHGRQPRRSGSISVRFFHAGSPVVGATEKDLDPYFAIPS